jgi:murein DD-endopeptidase MepM/ murein hydrolase activator NlpD
MTFSSSALLLRFLLFVSSAFAFALVAPSAGLAAEQGITTTTVSPPAETSSPTPAPEAPATPPAGSTVEAAPTSTPAPTTTPAPTSPEETPVVESTPQVQAQHAQGSTPGAPTGTGHAHAKKVSGSVRGEHEEQAQPTEGSSSQVGRAKHPAPSPSTLTPALPLALDAPISGVPSFFIESFRIPPFLLPIYQAAGTAYGVPWQVLAAINEVETDYGRDLSVSSAGAEGWMQFLPAEWEQYGVDANGAGFKDPYNPADAIFAAARYLRAAGGDRNIRAAVYSYNHSQAYVDSVMLRAQLLGGTPPELLGAITGLTEARFPVYAPSHYSDGFGTVAASGSSATGPGAPRTLVGTTIYSQAGAPVIAAQDGEIVQIGDSSSLGRFVALRDAYGNTYVYAQLGSVAALYPVLEPHERSAVSTRIAQPDGAAEPAPDGPATAGAQPRSPVSEGAAVSGFALGAPAALEPAPSTPAPAPPAASTHPAAPPKPQGAVRVFREGADDVYLHPLRAGVQVLAGTVLGHIGAAGVAATTAEAQPHMFFQIRPAGAGAPLIDPKPILDGWVALENTSIFRAKGENPFLATSPTVGQVLLESQAQLGPQVLHDAGIHLSRCGRQDVQTGRVDRRLLATLEFLSVSGLKPTVSDLRCGEKAPAAEGNASAGSAGDAVDIVAVNGTPIAGHEGPGSIADITVRKLLALQGASRPQRIVSSMSYPGAAEAIDKPSVDTDIRVAFSPAGGGLAHTADAFDSGLTPNEWIKLISRLGEIPDPTVAGKPSAAAIPDTPGPAGPAGGEEAARGNG